MTFTIGIPNDGQSLGSSKIPVRDNFQNYFDTMSVNHVAPNGAGGFTQGKHTIAEFVSQGTTDPTTSANEITLYGKAQSGSTELFIRKDSSGSVYQLTAGIPQMVGSNGTTFLPGGIILKYGSVLTIANTTTINISITGSDFPSNCFVVTATPSAGGVVVTAKSKTNITFQSSTGVTIYFIAIGN